MQTLRRITKPVTYTILAGFLSLSLHVPAAQAALVTTEAVVSAATADADRSRVRAALEREDVKQALQSYGVSAADVQARVDSLTDREAATLARQMDELPAGGSLLGALVFIFIVLLVTDLLGWTDVFPFTKKGSARR